MEDDTADRGRSDWPEWKHQMAAASRYWVSALLLVAMLGTGCSVKIKHVRSQLKEPVGMVIGAVCRFILLPLASFGFAHALELSPAQALGLIIVACSPGGSASNTVTQYVDGDVSFSKCVTVTDKVLALGMMPLNLFIYSRSWTSESIRIPYVKLVIILACILVPLGLGMLISWKLERAAQVLAKVGSVLGVILLVVYAVCQAILYPEAFTAWRQVWVSAALYALAALLVRFLFAKMCCRSAKFFRTVATETGVQNLDIALTIIAWGYQGEFAVEASVVPILTGLTVNVTAACFIVIYMLYKHCKVEKKDKTKSGKAKTKGRKAKTNKKERQEISM